MEDKDKTKEQLIKELTQMRQQTAKREAYMAKNSEKWLKALANNLTIGIYIVQDGKFRFANSIFRKYVGYSEEELYGMNSLNIVSPEDRDMVRENAVKMLKGERSSPYEFRYINKSREILWVVETVTSVQYQGRRAALGSFVDITKRKRVEQALMESEERLRATVMNAPIGIATSGMDRYFLSANDAFCRILGYTEAELQKMTFKDVTHPEDIKESIARVDDIDVGKISSFGQEKRYIKKDGQVIIGKVMVSAVRNHEGNPYLHIAELEDITERKKAENAVKQSEEKLLMILEKSADGIVILGDGLVKLINSKGLEMVQFSRGEVLGKPFADYISPRYRKQVMERYERRISGAKVPETYEIELLRKDGSIIPVEVHASLIEYDGKPATLSMARDITERKLAENNLIEANRRLHSVVSAAPIALWELDNQGNIVISEGNALSYLGTSPGERVGQSVYEVYKDDTKALENIRRGLAGETFKGETRVRDRVWMNEYTPRFNDDGEVIGLIGVSVDITEIRKAEEELLLRSDLLDTESDCVYVYDFDGNFIYINKMAYILHGYTREELLNINISRLHDPELEQLVAMRRKEILKKGRITFEASHIHKNGSKIPLEIQAQMIEINDRKLIMSVARDITERRIAEEYRQKADKLESIGTLAGGIAHDFNNILTVIVGNIQLAGSYNQKGRAETAQEMLAEAEKACFRAKGLTQQLLTFSRGGAPVRKVMQVAELLKETATFTLRGTGCKPEFALSRDLWEAEVDEGQLSQVINNLVINANQSMPNGGVINIRAGNVKIGKENTLGLPEGRYIEIAVKDQGIGIPENIKGRIFEPYFTTKGKGCGLGLATSYSIVRNHGGTITFDSKIGEGTTFHVYLPATQEKHEEKTAKPVAAPQPMPLAQGRILVMDDEETIRQLLGRMLQGAGYEVELASAGSEAVQKYLKARESEKPYDIVILDLTIPGGMGGKEVIAKLREIDPGVKAIVSSGYASDPVMADYKKYGFSSVVTKPYSLAQMQETLRNILIEK